MSLQSVIMRYELLNTVLGDEFSHFSVIMLKSDNIHIRL